MKKLLLATAALLLVTASANADQITAVFMEPGFTPLVFPGLPDGTLGLNDQAFGTFQINDIGASGRPFLPKPGLLNSNVLSIESLNSATSHTLTISITEVGSDSFDTFGPNFITSAFDSVGLSPGWTASVFTFVNSVFVPVHQFTFTGTGGRTFGPTLVDLGSGTEQVTTIYQITTTPGTGNANLGADVSVSVAVPGPIVGAGLPGLLGALSFGGWWFRRRRKAIEVSG